VALFCQNVTVGGGTLSEKAGAPTPSSNNDECGIYLAQSTIPNAGLGMFAGKDYKKNSKVTDGDIIVPLIEVDWNNDHDDIYIYITPSFIHSFILVCV
jgi:hypothetical protein